uniref:Protein quiver n=2 Tax=Cacopsylla melanoneura TaxID=428564 RepID=A0A8D8T3T7_9HEMI
MYFSYSYFLSATVVLGLVLVNLPGGNGIHCFVCNSRNDNQCEYLMSNDTASYQYVPCNDYTETGEPPFCRKIVQYVKDYDIYRVIRKCGFRRHHKDCYTVKNADHDETVCQCFEDGCNSSSSNTVSTTILGLCVFGATLKMIFML